MGRKSSIASILYTIIFFIYYFLPQVGTFNGRLCIIDSISKKCMQIPWQCYKIRSEDESTITALAWSSHEYQLAWLLNLL